MVEPRSGNRLLFHNSSHFSVSFTVPRIPFRALPILFSRCRDPMSSLCETPSLRVSSWKYFLDRLRLRYVQDLYIPRYFIQGVVVTYSLYFIQRVVELQTVPVVHVIVQHFTTYIIIDSSLLLIFL